MVTVMPSLIRAIRRHGYSDHRGYGWHSGYHGRDRNWDHARDRRYGPGPAPHGRAAAPVGSGNAYMGWLGAHGSYR